MGPSTTGSLAALANSAADKMRSPPKAGGALVGTAAGASARGLVGINGAAVPVLNEEIAAGVDAAEEAERDTSGLEETGLPFFCGGRTDSDWSSSGS